MLLLNIIPKLFLLAKINNGYKELSSPITENCEIEFLDLSSREGNRCHVNGLVYMLVYAVKKLYGKKEDNEELKMLESYRNSLCYAVVRQSKVDGQRRILIGDIYEGEKEVYLFGEGYGPKIQKDGHKYNNIPSFVVFDIKINEVYLSYDDMITLCKQLNLDYVPVVLVGTIDEAISKVKMHNLSQLAVRNLKRQEDVAYSEGVVGRPLFELKDKMGKRIIVKIKYSDFKN